MAVEQIPTTFKYRLQLALTSRKKLRENAGHMEVHIENEKKRIEKAAEGKAYSVSLHPRGSRPDADEVSRWKGRFMNPNDPEGNFGRELLQLNTLYNNRLSTLRRATAVGRLARLRGKF